MSNAARKILIVEDHELNLKMTKTLLEIAGYQTIAAANAEESIHMAVQQLPDLILMDMHLPGKNGYVASKELKNIPQTTNIPIVAYTALAMPEEQKKALDYGCVGVISKPIDASTFAETVGSYMLTSDETESLSDKARIQFAIQGTIALTAGAMPLQDLLRSWGHKVLQIEMSINAIIQDDVFDLLILDDKTLMEMDEHTLEMLQEVLPQRKQVAILATDFSSQDVLFRANDWIIDYLTKPFLPLEVEARVSTIIRAQKVGQKQPNTSVEIESQLETFIQKASHDLQGPIRKISQFVSFLSQGSADPSEDTHYLQGIARNVRHLENTLANLLRSFKQ